MNEEAVIRFHFEQDIASACQESDVEELKKWRRELLARSLVGQQPGRYGGFGYGNLSKRMPDGTILITGSQTGHLEALTPAHYARVLDFDPDQNWVRSEGQTSPSSETMTHLAVYRSDAMVGFVFHTHSPEIWQARSELNLPTTDPRFECGTVDLFHEVQRLLQNPSFRMRGILAMGGHRDGILTWGKTADEAGSLLLRCLGAGS
jgi:ribulose-5-phosphate 4-epimerase/fuculose-1-phosphate aldolase